MRRTRPAVTRCGSSRSRAAARDYQLTRDGGSHPLWAPDGQSLYFDRDHQMFQLAVNTQDVASIGEPTPLPIKGFAQAEYRRQFDLMPNGRQFLCSFRRPSAPRRRPPFRFARPKTRGEGSARTDTHRPRHACPCDRQHHHGLHVRADARRWPAEATGTRCRAWPERRARRDGRHAGFRGGSRRYHDRRRDRRR